MSPFCRRQDVSCLSILIFFNLKKRDVHCFVCRTSLTLSCSRYRVPLVFIDVNAVPGNLVTSNGIRVR